MDALLETGIGFNLNDMSSIAAACKTMALMLFKEGKSAEDTMEAMHLAHIAMKIEAALGMVKEEKAD